MPSDGIFEVERHAASAMSSAHWHNHVELNLLLAGKMTYLFNGHRESLEAGHLALFWAAIPHRAIEVSTDAPLVCAYLPISDFLVLPIERGFKQAVMQGRFLTTQTQSQLDVIAAARWAEEWQAGELARTHLVSSEIRLRIRRLSLDNAEMLEAERTRRQSRANGQSKGRLQRVEQLIALIDEHFAEPLSLRGLATLAGIHPTTAASAFRSILGITINEYLIRFRLARAMHLLADTEESILNVAYSTGFGSVSRFYELFADRIGTSPKRFRDNLRAGATQARIATPE